MGHVFSSAETGYEKPHPEALRLALDAIEGAGETWMIGDSVRADVLGARAMGIPTILVRKRDEAIEPYAENLFEVATIVKR